jgi:hypothetical protein
MSTHINHINHVNPHPHINPYPLTPIHIRIPPSFITLDTTYNPEAASGLTVDETSSPLQQAIQFCEKKFPKVCSKEE